jgi:hypothetical protein
MPLPPDEKRSCRLNRFVPLLLLATVMPADRAPADDAARQAAAYLRWDRDLEPVPGGTVWLSSIERRVRDNLNILDDARRDVLHSQRLLDARIRANFAAWISSRRQIAALRDALASSDTSETDKRKIRQQIASWESQAVQPDRLGAEPDVRALVIQLVNHRNRLTLAVLTLRRLIPEIAAGYERLAADARVQAALRQLGPEHRLGPLSENYVSHLRRLPEYERIVCTDWVPIYLHSGQVRVDLIVNEQTPVTFSWLSSNEPLLLTDGVAESVGVDRNAADAVSIHLESGRTQPAQPATLASVRLGRHVLHEVPAYVLPPEAEDAGARIGVDAWSDYEVAVQLDRLRLIVRAKEMDP